MIGNSKEYILSVAIWYKNGTEAELALLCGQIDEKRALNDEWEGDEEYMKDFQNQTPHWRGGEERNKCKYCMIYSEDLY